MPPFSIDGWGTAVSEITEQKSEEIAQKCSTPRPFGEKSRPGPLADDDFRGDSGPGTPILFDDDPPDTPENQSVPMPSRKRARRQSESESGD